MKTLLWRNLAWLLAAAALFGSLPGAEPADSAQEERALCLAQELISQVRARPLDLESLPPGLDDSAAARRELNAAPFSCMPRAADVRRNIQIRRLGPGHRSRIARVQVRVFWTAAGQEASVELVAYRMLKRGTGR